MGIGSTATTRSSCVRVYSITRVNISATTKEIASKKAVVNIQNKDDLCFLWAVIAGIHGNSDPEGCNPQPVAHYQQWEHEFNLTGIAMPMALKDIPRFERMNNE